MKNRLIHIVIIVLFASTAFAQGEMKVIDSLKQAAASQKGREKVMAMLELSKAFYDVSFDDCVAIGEAAIADSKRLKDKSLEAEAYYKLGVRYMYHYDLDLSRTQLTKALQLMPEDENSETKMLALNCLGRVELFMGNVDEAIAVYQQALRVSEALHEELNCADVTNNMAYIYFQQGDSDKAFDEFMEARNWFDRLDDTLSVAQCDNNIASIYYNWQQYDKAKEIFTRIVPVFQEYGDDASLASVYQNLGLIYANAQINYDSAIYYYRSSMECAQAVGDIPTLIDDKIEMASLLSRQGENIVTLLNETLSLSENIGYKSGELSSLAQLGIHYNKVNDYSKSVEVIEQCLKMEKESGMNLYNNALRHYLIMDYAHLGRLDEMNAELQKLSDEYDAAVGENDSYINENRHLKINAKELLQKNETISKLNESQDRQMRAYRLAFFGLLAVVLSVVLVLLLRHFLKKR